MPVDEKPLDLVVIKSQALYGKEVNVNRAIPDLRDGLKPVQRRILYTAFDEHLSHTHRYMKVAKLSGQVLGLHPHGDASINDAMIPISQNWKVNVPLIDIHGNNGAIDGSKAAAPRYIEARLTEQAELLLKGLDKHAVKMIDNFDGTKKEPVVLPASWPVVMANGTTGIAFGMASNVLPHNIIELLKAAIHLVDDPSDEMNQLPTIIKGPDFPTGGMIIGKDSCREELDNPHVKYEVHGKAEIDFENREIVISEIPYATTTEAVIKSLGDLLESQKSVLGLTKINDETTENVRIVLEFRKKATKQQLETTLNMLFTNRKSLLNTTITTDNHLVWNGRPGRFGIHQYLLHFLKFRTQVLTKMLRYDVEAANARLNVVNGLLKMVDLVDQIIPLAKASKNREQLDHDLMKKFDFNNPQAHAISGIAVYRLGKQNVEKLQQEQHDLQNEINLKQSILSSKSTFLQFLKADLKHTLKVFAKPEYQRKTKIVDAIKQPKEAVAVEDLIKPQAVVVVVKSTGIVQQMTSTMYENSKDEPLNGDDIVNVFQTQTNHVLMGFTANGLAFTRIVNDLPYQNLKSEPDGLQMQIPSYKRDDETLNAVVFDEQKADNYYVVSLTSQGHLKVGALSKSLPSLNSKRYVKNTTKYNGLRLKNDYVVKVLILTREQLESSTLHLESNKKRTKARDIVLADETIQGASGSGRRVFKLDPTNGDHFTDISLSSSGDDEHVDDFNEETDDE